MRTLKNLLILIIAGSFIFGSDDKTPPKETYLDRINKEINFNTEILDSLYEENEKYWAILRSHTWGYRKMEASKAMSHNRDIARPFQDNLDEATRKKEEYLADSARESLCERAYSDRLFINLSDKKYFIVSKNEEEGVKEIQKKIKGRNSYEEAWIYLPEKQMWYETGFNSTSKSAKKSVKPSIFRIAKIIEENEDIKTIIDYHNHPSGKYDGYPSLFDLEGSYKFKEGFPDHEVITKIITKNQVIEYSLNPTGIEELKRRKELNIPPYMTLEEYEEFYKESLNIKCTKNKK